MSVQDEIRRLTAPDIRARKGGEPIVCLTSYHAHTARLVDAYCDVILVGDSLGMVMHGLETTVPVTLDMMILQGHAVMRGSKRALVVVDMPFGSYESSKEQAFMNASRVLKETGCGAIKVEGGKRMAETIALSHRARRPGDGACRIDAAGDQHNRFVPRARPRRGGLVAHRGGHHCCFAGGCVFGSDRGRGRAPGAQIDVRGCRFLRSELGRVLPATGKFLFSRTCSVCPRGYRNSSSAMELSDPASRRRSPIMLQRCAHVPFLGRSTSIR